MIASLERVKVPSARPSASRQSVGAERNAGNRRSSEQKVHLCFRVVICHLRTIAPLLPNFFLAFRHFCTIRNLYPSGLHHSA